MSFRVVIPARYQSTRLPGKPLVDIHGKPMIQRVVEQALQSGAEQVVVATDDQRVLDAVQGFNGEVCLTQTSHTSGTDRLAEVIDYYNWTEQTIVVNVQGDEPFIPPANIEQVAQTLANHDAPMATLSTPLDSEHLQTELLNSNTVKVVTNAQGQALYFSRAPVPYLRDADQADFNLQLWQRHIGIYAYRAGFVQQFTQLPAAPIEQCEALEQLRVLWHGYAIQVDTAVAEPVAGIDTPADLERVRNHPLPF